MGPCVRPTGKANITSSEVDRSSASVRLYQCVLDNEHHRAERCIEQGADVNHHIIEAAAPVANALRAACRHGRITFIGLLLEKGAQLFSGFEADGWSALHSAAEAGHEHACKLLLEKAEEDIQSAKFDGFPLLHIIVECANGRLRHGGADLVSLALRRLAHADVNAVSRRRGFEGWTALHLACARGHARVTDCLIREGAEVGARTADFHVRSVKLNGWVMSDPNMVRVASVEPNLEHVDSAWFDKGVLPIHLAAMGGRLRIVQALLRFPTKAGLHGLNATTEMHVWTPLMFAVWGGHVSCVEEMLRIGARVVVNGIDRGPAGEWSPLAIAVAKQSIAMVNTLVAYGADPLVRLRNRDFPGQTFVEHIKPALPDAGQNRWSGPDNRITLLHIAVLRGHKDMLKHVLLLMRAAHKNPIRMASHRPELLHWCGQQGDTCGHDDMLREVLAAHALRNGKQMRGGQSARKGRHPQRPQRPTSAPGKPVPHASHTAKALLRPFNASLLPKEHVDNLAKHAPQAEGYTSDPACFTTAEGWSPIMLAVLLHTVDCDRSVRMPLLEDFWDATRGENDRSEVVLELLSSGAVLLEDQPHSSTALTVPQRFSDVSEVLAMRTLDEFQRLGRLAQKQKQNGEETGMAMARVLQASLCEACRFNRLKVVEHLLSVCGCDPHCTLLPKAASQPLHIASKFGFGLVAQALLNHRADPGEADDRGARPIQKLTQFYTQHIAELQAKVSMLETRISEMDKSKTALSALAAAGVGK